MKYFITGVGGQLGYDLLRRIDRSRHQVIGSDLLPTNPTDAEYLPLDITDREAVAKSLRGLRPDVVIHCAAWTAVDAAEEPENLERVRRINVDGTRWLAELCGELGSKLIYISTDYVFDGQGSSPWSPDCEAYAPQNVYGQTKLDGERAVASLVEHFFIVRIAWVFGAHGKNFVKTMLRLGKSHPQLRVVCDQIGTPTYTWDLARLLLDLSESEAYGYYHATNEGAYISWADFAREIMVQAGLPAEILPVTTAEYGLSKAVRPFNSRLDRSKLVEKGFRPLPDWRDALHRYLQEIGEIK